MRFIKSKLVLFVVLSFISIGFSNAENPIFSQRYTADPHAMVYNGRVYIYASHDIDKQERYWMNDITCISSSDMVNWTDHGEVFKVPENASWATQAWAPTVAFRNNQFYLYFGDSNRSVGVATSKNPTGPFVDAIGKPLITKDLPNCNVAWCYDPCVLVDTDGQAYISFGGGPRKPNAEGKMPENARIIKLGKDMISTVGEAATVTPPGFFEGSELQKRTVNGITKYYYSYFKNENGLSIDYMMSDTPMTGWEYKGTLLAQPATNNNNIQSCMFEFGGKRYITYHDRKIANDRKVDALRQRSVCVDEVSFNDDFSIKPVQTTSTGVAQIGSVNPYQQNEAETMAAQSHLLPGIETIACNDDNGGRAVSDIDNGDWIKIVGVDFGKSAKSFSARVASPNAGSSIEIRIDSENGKLIGICKIAPTVSFDKWATQTCKIRGAKGKHDLFLKFVGGEGSLMNFNWWEFSK